MNTSRRIILIEQPCSRCCLTLSCISSYFERVFISFPNLITPQERRVQEVKIKRNNGGLHGWCALLYYVEVKSGSSPYGGLQKLKDIWIQRVQGVPTIVERVD
jgi:hypothetical protein